MRRLILAALACLAMWPTMAAAQNAVTVTSPVFLNTMGPLIGLPNSAPAGVVSFWYKSSQPSPIYTEGTILQARDDNNAGQGGPTGCEQFAPQSAGMASCGAVMLKVDFTTPYSRTNRLYGVPGVLELTLEDRHGNVLSLQSSVGLPFDGNWHHVFISWSTGGPAGDGSGAVIPYNCCGSTSDGKILNPPYVYDANHPLSGGGRAENQLLPRRYSRDFHARPVGVIPRRLVDAVEYRLQLGRVLRRAERSGADVQR